MPRTRRALPDPVPLRASPVPIRHASSSREAGRSRALCLSSRRRPARTSLSHASPARHDSSGDILRCVSETHASRRIERRVGHPRLQCAPRQRLGPARRPALAKHVLRNYGKYAKGLVVKVSEFLFGSVFAITEGPLWTVIPKPERVFLFLFWVLNLVYRFWMVEFRFSH